MKSAVNRGRCFRWEGPEHGWDGLPPDAILPPGPRTLARHLARGSARRLAQVIDRRDGQRMGDGQFDSLLDDLTAQQLAHACGVLL